MSYDRTDVLIVGAGAAGLTAARELVLAGRTVTVIEAGDSCGGRIKTAFTASGHPIELGAEFVHGDLPLTKEFLKRAAVSLLPVRGSIWQYRDGRLTEQDNFIEDYKDLEKKFRELKQDTPVAEFLQAEFAGPQYEDLRFSLKNYVEGYYAADTRKASTLALCEELTNGDEEQFRPEGGYAGLVAWLEKECRQHGVQFRFAETVKVLRWRKDEVQAATHSGTITANKAVVTVSVGAWQQESIHYEPALAEKNAASKHLGFGPVQKISLLFNEAFWKDNKFTNGKNLKDLGFLFSGEKVPTWWTLHPSDFPILTGWLAGPKATATSNAGKGELVQDALLSLGKIFSIDWQTLSQKLVSSYSYDWQSDPRFCGAYSYEVIGGKTHQELLKRPVENTLFFAGEGLHNGPQIGTVEAALITGQQAAQELIALA